MFKNYIKIALRNLWKSKSFSMINIFGLSVGMACCLLIMLFIEKEQSYDQHYTDSANIYRLITEFITSDKREKSAGTAAPLAFAMQREFPEVVASTRLLVPPMVDKSMMKIIDNGQVIKSLYETKGYLVDSTFFQVFDYEFIYGNPQKALYEPNSVVLTQEVAEKLFGKESPLDKTLRIGNTFGEEDFRITGVIKNDKNTHITARFFIAMRSKGLGEWVMNLDSWASNNMFTTYLKLQPNTDYKALEAKIPTFFQKYGAKQLKELGIQKNHYLQPLLDIHLRSDFNRDSANTGSITYLYILGTIALFTLLIACINFMNLSTARSSKRAQEVGVRKVMGAVRSMIIRQFLGESLIISFIALLLAYFLVELSLPIFNNLTGKILGFNILKDYNKILWLVALAGITGILAGSYPAFYLSAFNPANVLKGKLMNSLSAIALRKGLVVFQFVISICLILATVVIYRQMRFIQEKDLGFEKAQKIIVPLQTDEVGKTYTVFRDEILKNPQITNASAGTAYPSSFVVHDKRFFTEGKSMDDASLVRLNYIDYGYNEALGMKLLKGRYFSKDFPSDTSKAIVLNESAIKSMNIKLEEAIGKKVYWEWEGRRTAFELVGVVKDFHFETLHKKVEPFGFLMGNGTKYTCMVLNTNSKDLQGTLRFLEDTWQKINANAPFEYSFLDQEFQKKYESEQKMSAIVTYFTLIAILISCLGLYGLTTFTAEQKMKEIGVRKVMGASVSGLIFLLSKDFTKLVMIAFLIAAPIGYYAMDKWLAGFAFKTDIGIGTFLIAGLSALSIALLTVSYRSVKAALANPVKSLRSE